MKKDIYFLIAALLFSSCFEKIGDDDIVTSEYFDISGDLEITFTNNVKSSFVTIEGKSCHWWFENIPTWVILSDIEGNESKQVTIKVIEDNPSTTSSRTETMKVRIAAFAKEIILKQEPSEPTEFTVTPTELSFDGLGGTKTLSLIGKGAWSISSNKDWCTITPNSGNGSTEVMVTVSKNGTTELRNAILIVANDGSPVEVTIIQLKGYSPIPGGDDNPNPTY